MNRARVKQLFLEVAQAVAAEIETGTAIRAEPGIVTTSLLVRSGFIFEGRIANLFHQKVDDAAGFTRLNPAWSKASIDGLFSAGLDLVIGGRTPKDAARELERKLNIQPTNFRVRCAIFGLSPTCQPASFGGIKLFPHSYVSQHDFGVFLKGGVPRTLHFAEIEVEAVDAPSAQVRAEAEIDKHISILNIFCAEAHSSKLFLTRLETPRHDFAISQLVISNEWTTGGSSSLVHGIISSDHWREILNQRFLKRISYLLTVETKLSSHLIQALEIVAGTSRERSPKNAFLLLAIGLESALLLSGKSEIAQQFAMRTTLLSIAPIGKRREIFRGMKRLYELRSAIAHGGKKDVTESDLAEMRHVTTGCIFTLCAATDFTTMTTTDELESWFLDRMLSSEMPSFAPELQVRVPTN